MASSRRCPAVFGLASAQTPGPSLPAGPAIRRVRPSLAWGPLARRTAPSRIGPAPGRAPTCHLSFGAATSVEGDHQQVRGAICSILSCARASRLRPIQVGRAKGLPYRKLDCGVTARCVLRAIRYIGHVDLMPPSRVAWAIFGCHGLLPSSSRECAAPGQVCEGPKTFPPAAHQERVLDPKAEAMPPSSASRAAKSLCPPIGVPGGSAAGFLPAPRRIGFPAAALAAPAKQHAGAVRCTPGHC